MHTTNLVAPNAWLLVQIFGLLLLAGAVVMSVLQRRFTAPARACLITGILLVAVPEITAVLLIIGVAALAVTRVVRSRRHTPDLR